MSSLPTEKYIIELATDLWVRRDSVTLDQIDFRFYTDIIEWDTSFQFIQATSLFSDIFDEIESLPEEERITRRAEFQSRLFDARRGVHHFQRLSPDLDRLMASVENNEIPSLRSSLWECVAAKSRVEPVWRGLEINIPGVWIWEGVRDARWRGRDFATDVLKAAEHFKPFIDTRGAIEAPEAMPGASVRFLYWEAGSLSWPSFMDFLNLTGEDEILIQQPMIVASVGVPIPSRAVLEVLYDEMLASTGWAQRLYGGDAQDQSKEVAIRTWTIGLLKREGLTHMQAVQSFAALSGLALDNISTQQGFQRQLNALYDRVPEVRGLLRGQAGRPRKLQPNDSGAD